MKILQLIPDLHYTGSAKQMATLALGLPRERFQVQIAVLRETQRAPDCGMTEMLRHGGVPVHVLGKPRRFPFVAAWNLRRLVHSFHPDVIHVWGGSCLRVLTLAGPVPPVVAADMLPARRNFVAEWWERWLLKRPARIVARGEAEADRYRRAGAPAANIIPIAPAIPRLPFFQESQDRLASLSPERTRFVLCAGSMEPHRGFRNAIWTLDILNILFDDLHLLLVGDGPDRANLERFARGIQLRDRVHFIKARADIRPFLDRAELIWVPSVGDCGLSITLEAMAAGKPVVASNVPSLRAIIRDGETGFLIPPGEKVALGRRTRELLRNPDLARRMGESGRRLAASYTPGNFIARIAEVYRGIAA